MNWKSLTSGFLAGFILCSVVMMLLFSGIEEEEYTSGYNQGFTSGLHYAADTIKKVFGTYDRKSPYQALFDVKATTVVAVDSSGVQTIRVYE
ncbi:MAG: hypothetical protein AB7H80_04560 [Candidatus Kapaibacterium sp.]